MNPLNNENLLVGWESTVLVDVGRLVVSGFAFFRGDSSKRGFGLGAM